MNLYQCEQCDWLGERDAAVEIADPLAKAKPGRPFTDRACPTCGYNCFPAEARPVPPFPPTGLVVEQDIGMKAWANIRFPGSDGPFSHHTVGAAHMYDRNTNMKHALLFAAAGDMYEALEAFVTQWRTYKVIEPVAPGNDPAFPSITMSRESWERADAALQRCTPQAQLDQIGDKS